MTTSKLFDKLTSTRFPVRGKSQPGKALHLTGGFAVDASDSVPNAGKGAQSASKISLILRVVGERETVYCDAANFSNPSLFPP